MKIVPLRKSFLLERRRLGALLLLLFLFSSGILLGNDPLYQIKIRTTHRKADSSSDYLAEKSTTTITKEGIFFDHQEKITEYPVRILTAFRISGGGRVLGVQRADGWIETIHQPDVISLEKTGETFKPMTHEELSQLISEEAGRTFQTLFHPKSHFLIVYDTSEAYALWCQKLLDNLYVGFDKYQEKRDLHLPEPEFPMPVIIFSNRQEFEDYARRIDDIKHVDGILAYYNRLSNRIVLYDQSGIETALKGQKKQGKTSQIIEEILSRPQAAENVSAIIHEATHQIAFNRKMFHRTGPQALWMVEGLSLVFETPDARSSTGWSRRNSQITPNSHYLGRLKDYFAHAGETPIQDIIQLEQFTPEKMSDQYALSWGLFHYLNVKEPEKLTQYIQRVQEKKLYEDYAPEDRLHDFESIFGDDWNLFYKKFIKYMSNVMK